MSTEVVSPEAVSDAEIPPRPSAIMRVLPWLILCVLTGIGAYYRFLNLELKPLHHDEGVNGWFILRILDEHVYKYNPKNYHGPLLYLLNTLAVIVGGRTVAALRFMPALFGLLAIPAMALFRRVLGWSGVLIAAAYIAIAPLEVYFSRTAIHEVYNFVFNLTLVGGVVAWAARRERKYLVLAALSLVCLFGTKETTIITLAAVVPALVVGLMFGREPLPGPTSQVLEGGPGHRLHVVIEYLIELVKTERKSFQRAAIVAVILWALLFSSLGTNPKGLGSFFAAFVQWGDTGTAGKGHEKPWPYFITHLLWPYYRPLLIWGSVGLVWASIRRERFGLFALVWFVLVVAAYSIIPYKTPWCVLSFSGPLFIGMGLLIKESVRVIRSGAGVPAKLASAAVVAVSLVLIVPYAVPMSPAFREYLSAPKINQSSIREQLRNPVKFLARQFIPGDDSWTINFDEYDVKGHPFIYVQNLREYLDLINDLHGLIETAQLEGDDQKPRILMIDAKNPMRWYLQKTGTQTWRGKLDDEAKKKLPDDVDVVCTSAQYTTEIKTLLGEGFTLRRYHERPGRKIDLYVRTSLWKNYEAVAAKGQALPPSPAFNNKNVSERLTAAMRDPWSRRAMN